MESGRPLADAFHCFVWVFSCLLLSQIFLFDLDIRPVCFQYSKINNRKRANENDDDVGV